MSAKSQLLCLRCGHSEDEHNWSTGPCSHKDGTTPFYPHYLTHCTCYAMVSKFDVMRQPADIVAAAVLDVTEREVASIDDLTHAELVCVFILLHAEGRI